MVILGYRGKCTYDFQKLGTVFLFGVPIDRIRICLIIFNAANAQMDDLMSSSKCCARPFKLESMLGLWCVLCCMADRRLR